MQTDLLQMINLPGLLADATKTPDSFTEIFRNRI